MSQKNIGQDSYDEKLLKEANRKYIQETWKKETLKLQTSWQNLRAKLAAVGAHESALQEYDQIIEIGSGSMLNYDPDAPENLYPFRGPVQGQELGYGHIELAEQILKIRESQNQSQTIPSKPSFPDANTQMLYDMFFG